MCHQSNETGAAAADGAADAAVDGAAADGAAADGAAADGAVVAVLLEQAATSITAAPMTPSMRKRVDTSEPPPVPGVRGFEPRGRRALLRLFVCGGSECDRSGRGSLPSDPCLAVESFGPVPDWFRREPYAPAGAPSSPDRR